MFAMVIKYVFIISTVIAVHVNLQWKPFSTIQNKTFSCCISIFCLLFSWKLKYRDNLGQQDIRIKLFSISLHAAFTSVFILLYCCIYIAYISEKKDFVIIQFTWIFIRLILTIIFTDCPLRFHINTCWIKFLVFDGGRWGVPYKPYLHWLVLRFIGKYFNPSRPNPERREKIKLNFYFHISLWCLTRFYKGLKGLDKTFWGTTEKCEKGVLKISTKFTGEHPCWSVISVELQSSFNKIKLRHGCSWTAASEFHSFIHCSNQKQPYTPSIL